MPKKLIEEIILKVGIDATGVASGLSKLDADLKSIQIQFGKTEKATESNTAAQKKAIPVAKQTGLAMSSLDKELDKAEDGWRNLSKALKKYEKDSKKANQSTNSLNGGLGKLGAVVGVGASIAVVTNRINEMTQTAQDADRLGVVTQNLANLQGVGKTFGATAEDVTQGIKNINESASEALADGSGEKFDLFKELNIDLVEFNKLKPDEQLESFSKSINGVESQGRRTAIQLALMGEEGFKLATTMDELAVNAEGAKARVEEFTGSLNPEEIKKLNKSVAETKMRFDGVLNTLISAGSSTFNQVGESIENLSYMLFGLNKAQEDYNDAISRTMRKEKALYNQRKKEQKEEAKRLSEEENKRKDLAALIKDIQENEFKDTTRAGGEDDEGSLSTQKKFKELQKEQRDIDEKILESDAKKFRSLKKLESKEKKNKENAIKAIEDIELKRKKALIKRLQDESKRGGGAGIIEAGSVEEAELNASLANRDVDKLSRIETFQKEVKAEEKTREQEKLKIAKETLAAIKTNKTIKVNTSSL